MRYSPNHYRQCVTPEWPTAITSVTNKQLTRPESLQDEQTLFVYQQVKTKQMQRETAQLEPQRIRMFIWKISWPPAKLSLHSIRVCFWRKSIACGKSRSTILTNVLDLRLVNWGEVHQGSLRASQRDLIEFWALLVVNMINRPQKIIFSFSERKRKMCEVYTTPAIRILGGPTTLWFHNDPPTLRGRVCKHLLPAEKSNLNRTGQTNCLTFKS